MNYKKHMQVFGAIALIGFIIFWFAPQLGAAIFLPALGAYFGARKAESEGPAQPNPLLWVVFFVFVAVAGVIRFLVPEENFGGFEAAPENLILLWVYLGVLSLAFPLFGFLAYLQRVGRLAS
jgi:glucan phosphoethanolaminetransferase (alkaline phosphatase superfamily)